jgi:hypothetical protein
MSTDSRTVSTHTADYIPAAACFTVITAPQTITKTYAKDAAGQLVKKAAAAVGRSIAERVTVYSATDLAQCINRLSTKQAIMHGVHDAKRVTVYSQKRYNALDDKRGAVTRTKAMTAWPASGGVLVIDYDPPAGGDGWTLEQLKTEIRHILPLDAVAHVTGYSSSSFIYDGDLQLQAQRGLRIYILVTDASDIPRAGQVIFDRLWLGGHGYYALSKSGGMLNRSAIDSSVWQPSRLDFASGAQCSAPINQRRPAMTASNGDLLDTRRLLPDLSDAERSRLDTLQAAARQAITPQAERIRGVYIKDRAKQQAKRETPQGANPERLAVIEKQIERSLDSTFLHADWLVMLDDGTVVSIAEIYANRAKYHCATAKDPIEHDYNDYHTCAIIYTDRNSVAIVSQAHGKRTHTCLNTLHDDKPVFSIETLKQLRNDAIAADDTDPLDDAEPLSDEQHAANAFRYAMHLIPHIPRRAAVETVRDKLDEKFSETVGITTRSVIYSHVLKIVEARKKAALSRITVSPSITRRHNAQALDALSAINTAEIVAKGGVHVIQAATGTGKTQHVIKPLVDHIKGDGQQVAVIAPARSLVAELSRRLNLTHYEDVKDDAREMRRTGHAAVSVWVEELATCINSIGNKVFEKFFSDLRYILIDEFTQVLAAFASKTTFSGGVKKCFDLLRTIISSAELVVVADANINDDALKFLERCRPAERFNLYNVQPTDTGKTTIIYADQAELLDQIAEDVVAHEMRVWVTCDTVAEAKRVHSVLTEHYGVKAKLITVDTKDKDSRAFLADIDLESLNYDVVVSSPKIKSGVSVEHNDVPAGARRFDYVAGIFSGKTVSSADAYQMLGRVRYAREYHVFIAEPRMAHAISVETDTSSRDAMAAIEHDATRSSLLTRHNAGVIEAYKQDISAFADRLFYTLLHHRHTITRAEYRAAGGMRSDYADVKAALKEQDIAALIAAEPIDAKEAAELERELYLDESQVWQLKAFAMRRYLNLPHDAVLDECILNVNMAELRRFAVIQQTPVKSRDYSGKDLCERDFSKALQAIIDQVSSQLNIRPDALYDDAMAVKALDILEPHRLKLAVVGFIPARFGTRYYKRGVSAVKELNQILTHWGIHCGRCNNPANQKWHIEPANLLDATSTDITDLTSAKVAIISSVAWRKRQGQVELHLSTEMDTDACMFFDQKKDTCGSISKDNIPHVSKKRSKNDHMLGIVPPVTLHVNLIRHGIKFDIPPSNNGNNKPQQAKR